MKWAARISEFGITTLIRLSGYSSILFVVLIFVVFMSIMSFVSRSDISKWPIISGGAPAQPVD